MPDRDTERAKALSAEERRQAREMAHEIVTERGPDRVMEVQRARMWDREPSSWTRYERHIAPALFAAEQEAEALRRAREAVAAELDRTFAEANDLEARAESAERHARELEEALEKAIQVIEWCGANDLTPPYEYGQPRSNGDKPGTGQTFNTPREFARYWPDVLRERLAQPASEPAQCSNCGHDLHGYRGQLCRYCDPKADCE